MNDIRLPKMLCLGSATAGHQIEGDNVHCQQWHREMHAPCKAAQGRVPSGKACGHWNRYRADVDFGTFERTPKPSAEFCREMIRTRALPASGTEGGGDGP